MPPFWLLPPTAAPINGHDRPRAPIGTGIAPQLMGPIICGGLGLAANRSEPRQRPGARGFSKPDPGPGRGRRMVGAWDRLLKKTPHSRPAGGRRLRGRRLGDRRGHATPDSASPYPLLDQMARVLVLWRTTTSSPWTRRGLLDGAIKGMVAELDPHSAYMTAEDYALFNEDTEGSFGGIGVEVDFRDEHVHGHRPHRGLAGVPRRAFARAIESWPSTASRSGAWPSTRSIRCMRGDRRHAKCCSPSAARARPSRCTSSSSASTSTSQSVESKRLAGGRGLPAAQAVPDRHPDELLAAVAAAARRGRWSP